MTVPTPDETSIADMDAHQTIATGRARREKQSRDAQKRVLSASIGSHASHDPVPQSSAVSSRRLSPSSFVPVGPTFDRRPAAPLS